MSKKKRKTKKNPRKRKFKRHRLLNIQVWHMKSLKRQRTSVKQKCFAVFAVIIKSRLISHVQCLWVQMRLEKTLWFLTAPRTLLAHIKCAERETVRKSEKNIRQQFCWSNSKMCKKKWIAILKSK